jgi:ribosome-associated heat shock protein Hsp15
VNESSAPLPSGPESTRVDRWLWAVRVTKTRSDAAQACRGGHVRVNDRPAKPATTVKAGDKVRVRLHGVTRVLDVSHVIVKRVGAQIAARCYVDNTPAQPPQATMPVIRRDRGAGRPTKRDRRLLDRVRNDLHQGPPLP